MQTGRFFYGVRGADYISSKAHVGNPGFKFHITILDSPQRNIILVNWDSLGLINGV